MKANELRLGNYVSVAGHSAPIRIEAFSLDPTFGQCIVWWSDPVSKHIADMGCVSPIPLTEELLLSAGFEKKEHWEVYCPQFYTLNGISIFSTDWTITRFTLGWEDDTPLQYLHQLQNLYFALTGEELDVKLD